MLAMETVSVRTEMGHADVQQEEYYDTWASVVQEVIYLPSQKGYGRAATASKADRVGTLSVAFDAVCCDYLFVLF